MPPSGGRGSPAAGVSPVAWPCGMSMTIQGQMWKSTPHKAKWLVALGSGPGRPPGHTYCPGRSCIPCLVSACFPGKQ